MKKVFCIAIMLTCCLVTLLLPVSANDISGSCDDGVFWSYNIQTATLTISGEGQIPNYSYVPKNRPWEALSDLVETVRIDSGITAVGSHAFSYMKSVHTVQMADSVKKIESYAFSSCLSLREIVWSEQLIEIQDGAFSGCVALESVSFPDSVQKLGHSAFQYCSSLQTLRLNKVHTVGGRAFMYCSSLVNVDLGALKTIEYDMFNNCDSLAVLKNTGVAEAIESSAFSAASSLRAIGISSSVKEIWDRSFMNCTSLKQVVFFGNAPKFMPENVTYDTYGLPEQAIVYYPANDATWTQEARQALGPDALWIPVVDPSSVQMDVNTSDFSGDCGPNAKFNFKNGVLTISGSGKASHPNWDVLKPHIQQVVIKDGITGIGMKAFLNCKNLTKVSIAGSVTEIADVAFANCTKLSEISLPAKLKRIGENAFSGCDGLTKLVIPNSVTSIAGGAFSGCDNLERVEIGSGVQSVGARLFSESPKLREPAFLGTAPAAIDAKAFDGYKGYIYIKNWNSWSYEDKFLHGGSLTWVVGTGGTSGKCGNNATWKVEGDVLIISGTGKTWDFNVNRLAPWMPYQQNIRKAVVEEGITELGDDAFYGMEMLEEAEIADSVMVIGNDAFRFCNGLKSVKLSDNLKTIKEFAFLDCISLEKVVTPDSVEVIEYGVFSGCINLREVVLSRNIKSIGQESFAFCESLEVIHFMGNAPSFHRVAFDELETTVTYPWLNTTWTNDVLKNYGGKITWQHRECKGEHTFWEWERISEPTTENTGLEKGVCSNCGFVEERVIPKLPDPSSSTVTTPTIPVTQPSTSDDDEKVAMRPRLFSDEAILVCGVIAGVFVACSIVIFIRIAVLTQRAKKEKENEK